MKESKKGAWGQPTVIGYMNDILSKEIKLDEIDFNEIDIDKPISITGTFTPSVDLENFTNHLLNIIAVEYQIPIDILTGKYSKNWSDHAKEMKDFIDNYREVEE